MRAFKAVGGTPVFIKRGQGSSLYDEDGNEFIDYVCSWGPLILGHAQPRIVSAVKKAAERGSSFGCPTELETTLARTVCEAMPSIEMVRFVNSGTEAAMSAIRLARAFTGKNKVVKFPHYVVEDAIESAPAKFYAYGRRPEDDVLLEDNRVTFTNFGEGIEFVDPYTGRRRETRKADIEKAARIIDYLDYVETYERAMCSHDKPPETQALHNAEASLTNTVKHHWLGPVDKYQCGKIVEIMPLAQSTVSQHLKCLKEAGLVIGEVDGPRTCYCLDKGIMKQFKKMVAAL